MSRTLKWIYQYQCGCTDGPKYKKDMLEYCGKHGQDLLSKYPDLSPFMPQSELDKFRTRWRRWLGNKTRRGSVYYVSLFDANWVGWVYEVYEAYDLGIPSIKLSSTREEVKEIWTIAIDNADMDLLRKLDSLYAEEKIERRYGIG